MVSPHPYPEGQTAIGKGLGGVTRGTALKCSAQSGKIQRVVDAIPGELGQGVGRIRSSRGLCCRVRHIGAVKLKQLGKGMDLGLPQVWCPESHLPTLHLLQALPLELSLPISPSAPSLSWAEPTPWFSSLPPDHLLTRVKTTAEENWMLSLGSTTRPPSGSGESSRLQLTLRRLLGVFVATSTTAGGPRLLHT